MQIYVGLYLFVSNFVSTGCYIVILSYSIEIVKGLFMKSGKNKAERK